MKKIFITCLLLAGTVLVSYAQKDYEDLVQQFSCQPAAEHIHVGSFAMRLAEIFADKDDAQFISGIRSVSILSLECCDINIKEAFRQQAQRLSEKGLELIAEVSDESDQLRILAEVRNDKIHRFIVINVGEEPCLIQINGSIDLSCMEKMISQNI
ncbi:MAG TPA: DUF4252 domain-containing protein [Bacteroidales bacterium]|jgi:hypothetical protein|nr:DUF4252 domain-containing protein [Bacteroidales bacterium]MCZ2416438.1 DUF4252 domain-containing protein [Burkholderiales bacterium]OQC56405.1 MAG: hypothetical protein BWX52_01680 [Bacteroidetes bacterium ADurb.Bin013]MBV6456880.1 hypothetical protein [Bacteroidales bacterium]NLZ08555.1 DUF4252 domain-containing protein [Bacteroidales bacterium]